MQGTCVMAWFLHFSLAFPISLGKKLMFKHVTRTSHAQNLACTLRYVLLTKMVFQIFVHAGAKILQQPLFDVNNVVVSQF